MQTGVRINNHGELDRRLIDILALQVPLSAGRIATALWVGRETIYGCLRRLEKQGKIRIAGIDEREGRGVRAILYTLPRTRAVR